MARPRLKVVAHLSNGKLLKGYFDPSVERDLESMIRQRMLSFPVEIPIRSSETDKVVTVPRDYLKALFFVKTFEGRKDYKEVKFFQAHPPIEGLWVQVTFKDGEVTEGVLHNTIHHLVEPGFFLKPPDPQSNNEFVYVLKGSLHEFRVLGVRTSY
ncbi:MAG: hypothetical protein L0Z53_20130 [Acidobacteriales bacterium]|nr:hypothetical protein [Terriglobales bacterium]